MHRAILYDQIRDISHDIRTGGFVIISHTDSIGGAVQAASFEVADVLRRLGIIRQEAANVNQMAVDLKAPAAPPRLELHDVNLVVREAADALECKAVPKKVAIARDLWSADLVCQIDAGRIARAFKNIIKNAIEALQPGGLVRIRTAPVATGGWVEVVVEDNGPGIPVSLLARLKRGLPVDSDKPEGTGIGFASAKSTVEKDHGGRVEIDSEEGRGTKVTISFPTQAADGIGGNTT
jgi:two-component system sporulation sensor kinase A